MKCAALFVVAILTGLDLAALPAQAQLLSDRVVDNQRLCVYVGSNQLPDGQVASRDTVVPSSQPCPDIAPYRDPNRPVPGNAALIREGTQNARRQCVYAQGGVEYERSILITQQCAMTPDLLDRLPATRTSGIRTP